ncbi:MAG: AAA family ATPase [Myxococcales bacterium]|nr:AAA family ATPase [Myxococcales bacterium]
MKKLAVYSPKGGSGSTTLALHIAYELAHRGYRILLVDADPQGGVAASLQEKVRSSKGLCDVFLRDNAIEACLIKTRQPLLSLLPFGACSTAELQQLMSDAADGWLFQRVLDELPDAFDIVLFDVPSGVSPWSLGVLRVVEQVFVPLVVEPMALRVFPQVLSLLAGLRSEGSLVEFAGAILTMWRSEQPYTWTLLKELRASLPSQALLQAMVPWDPLFVQSQMAGTLLGLYSREPSPTQGILGQLVDEILRLGFVAEEAADESEPISLVV